jgi:glycolate oxidase iron-sulfur subunit
VQRAARQGRQGVPCAGVRGVPAPDAIATANAGCLLRIRRHLGDGVPLVHPVQLLDAAINGTPLPRG